MRHKFIFRKAGITSAANLRATSNNFSVLDNNRPVRSPSRLISNPSGRFPSRRDVDSFVGKFVVLVDGSAEDIGELPVDGARDTTPVQHVLLIFPGLFGFPHLGFGVPVLVIVTGPHFLHTEFDFHWLTISIPPAL